MNHIGPLKGSLLQICLTPSRTILHFIFLVKSTGSNTDPRRTICLGVDTSSSSFAESDPSHFYHWLRHTPHLQSSAPYMEARPVEQTSDLALIHIQKICNILDFVEFSYQELAQPPPPKGYSVQ